jgi:hypothetical protein
MRWNASAFLLGALMLGLGLSSLPVSAGGWTPTSAAYAAPATPGQPATLILLPESGAVYYAGPASPAPTVRSGSNVTVTANMGFLAIGLPPPPAPVRIPIAELPPGQYQLELRLAEGSAQPLVVFLPLTVAGGASSVPVDNRVLLVLFGLSLLAAGAAWLRR